MCDTQTHRHTDNPRLKLIDMESRSQVRCNALGLKIPGIKKYNFGKLSQSQTLVFDVVGFSPDSHTTFSVFQHRYDGGGI